MEILQLLYPVAWVINDMHYILTLRTKLHSRHYAKLAKKLDEKMERSREDNLTTNNDAVKVNKKRRRPYCRTEHYDVVVQMCMILLRYFF